jgi:hypothetical protein
MTIDDSLFKKHLKPASTLKPPIYWRSEIGLTASLPRAINYYRKCGNGWSSSDNDYHDEQIALVAGYFKQWLLSDLWAIDLHRTDELRQLREEASQIINISDLTILHHKLIAAGIDPV